jgi:acyl-CoA dehydrogenase
MRGGWLSTTTSSWMTPELDALRVAARDFLAVEAEPHQLRWREQHAVDREFWRTAGKAGLLCLSLPEEYGGGGGSLAADIVVLQEQYRIGETGWGNMVHSGIVANYLHRFATEQQRQRWLPGMASGDLVGAVAMSEPGAGSDLRGITSRAVRSGDGWLLSGSKTFISNGSQADLVIVAAKTESGRASSSISLFVIETADCPGFRRGGILDKMGQPSADTSELFFDDVRVPAEQVLGEIGGGLRLLMQELPRERLLIGVAAVSVAEAAVAQTIQYVKERTAFGAPLWDLQSVRFELAECATLVRVGRAFLDNCIDQHLCGNLDAATASMAKYWLTDMQGQVIDRCLQLFGGYGYMAEYPISRMYIDARAQRIYGGANEVMKDLIARSL